MKTPKPPISKHYSKTTKRAALLAACATFACGMLACCMPPYAHAMQTPAFNLGYDAQTRAFAPSSSTEFLASSEPLLPGDTVTSRLILSSQNETLHAVYLKAETAVETPEQTQALIRAFELTVSDETGNVLYCGTLGEIEPQGIRLDMKNPAQEHTSWNVSLCVPLHVGNEHAFAAGSIRWIFSAEELPGTTQQEARQQPFSATNDSMGLWARCLSAAACLGLSIMGATLVARRIRAAKQRATRKSLRRKPPTQNNSISEPTPQRSS